MCRNGAGGFGVIEGWKEWARGGGGGCVLGDLLWS